MTRGVMCVLLAATPVALADDVGRELQAHFDQACETQHFMGVASVEVNRRTVFAGACGWVDAGERVKNTTTTRFPIASITKEITASAVLLLHEEDKFSLSDPIGQYLPDIPDSWHPATIHQLLTHTSGVPIYTASADYSRVNPDLDRVDTPDVSPSELLGLVRERPLIRRHGEEFVYNNSGYILLGMLIEKLAETPYEHFIQERIFDRLSKGGDMASQVYLHLCHAYRKEPPPEGWAGEYAMQKK